MNILMYAVDLNHTRKFGEMMQVKRARIRGGYKAK